MYVMSLFCPVLFCVFSPRSGPTQPGVRFSGQHVMYVIQLLTQIIPQAQPGVGDSNDSDIDISCFDRPLIPSGCLIVNYNGGAFPVVLLREVINPSVLWR